MEKIQIKNLKSITDSGIIDIKPITVFVGQNSSGKSSLIRCFPLFKQSAESKILGTVLWSGKYVDYGSFDESLNYDAQNSEQKEISFSFTYHTPKNSVRHYFLEGTPVKVTIDVSGDEYKKNSYTNITYEIHGSSISMRITTDLKIVSAYINGNDFTKQITEIYRAFKSYSIIPILYSNARSISQATTPYSALAKEIKTHVHHRTSEEKIHRISQALRFADDDSIKRNLTNKAFVGDHAAAKILNWSTEDIAFKNIRDLIILSNLERIIDEVSEQLISHFLATKYITPLRAAADRYYRVQNTSIDELDPNGSNLAMFLRAKSELEIQEMNAWLVNEIGFSIDISGSHGHASIFVLDHVSRIRTNIADTGFGVSQILPVLVQIWQYSKVQAYRLRKSIVPITIIIEQPELHLHPKMQSRVGETFCKAIKMAENIGLQLRIIVETHSKDIIDSIGRCVENGIIKTESTAIYLINKEKKFNISRAYFDAGGFLLNWPYGFFDGA